MIKHTGRTSRQRSMGRLGLRVLYTKRSKRFFDTVKAAIGQIFRGRNW